MIKLVRRYGPAVAIVSFLIVLIPAPAPRAADDLVIAPDVPQASALGAYEGSQRIALGEIKDEVFDEGPDHVGMGPQARYKIVVEGSRVTFVKTSLTEALKRVGLLAEGAGAPALTLDVTILRDHVHSHQTFGRFRLRSEVFLQAVLRGGDGLQGRLLACGNAETYAQVASKEKETQTYQIGVNDAIYKILNSKTLARVLGAGWKPAAAPATSGEHDTTRIHKDEFYGPTDVIQAEIEKASKAVQAAGPYDQIVLPDFAVEEVKGKEDEGLDVGRARAFVPERIREHLNAFFPGAFASIQRGAQGAGARSLVVDGKLDKFRIGSLGMRIFVGFGAGKDKLEGKVALKDGSGKTLDDFAILSSNWGAGWQSKQGQVRDMADQLARDLAYMLVRTAVPEYKPPQDLEILFDDTTYPMKPRKS